MVIGSNQTEMSRATSSVQRAAREVQCVIMVGGWFCGLGKAMIRTFNWHLSNIYCMPRSTRCARSPFARSAKECCGEPASAGKSTAPKSFTEGFPEPE